MSFDQRPAADECAPFYHGYLRQVPDGDVRGTLERLGGELDALLAGLDPALAGHRYAPGKWSVAEVLGHVADAERVFAGRALWFARGGEAALPGFEQDDFVAAGRFDRRELADLAAEIRAIRASTLALVRGFDPGVLGRAGIASGSRCTVRAAIWMLAGHAEHHRRILEQRYLGA